MPRLLNRTKTAITVLLDHPDHTRRVRVHGSTQGPVAGGMGRVPPVTSVRTIPDSLTVLAGESTTVEPTVRECAEVKRELAARRLVWVDDPAPPSPLPIPTVEPVPVIEAMPTVEPEPDPATPPAPRGRKNRTPETESTSDGVS